MKNLPVKKHPNRRAERAWRQTVENMKVFSVEEITRLLMIAEHELHHAQWECWTENLEVKKTHTAVYHRVQYVEGLVSRLLNGKKAA